MKASVETGSQQKLVARQLAAGNWQPVKLVASETGSQATGSQQNWQPVKLVARQLAASNWWPVKLVAWQLAASEIEMVASESGSQATFPTF